MRWLISSVIFCLLSLFEISLSRFLIGSCLELDEACGINGTCIDGPLNEYEVQYHWCRCDAGYGGASCEKKCSLDCGIGNKCIFDLHATPKCVCEDCDNEGRPRNICPPSFERNKCTTQDGWCYPNKCLNGGKCFGIGDDAKCVCPVGYEGKYCEKDIDECADDPYRDRCYNGQCINTFGSYECDCYNGYQPPSCVVRTSSPPIIPFSLSMRPPHCLVHFSELFPNGNSTHCLNHGSCVKFGNNQTRCDCPPGFEGEICEKVVDECLANPCQNGGTCVSGKDGFKCLCMMGFEGELCENNLDDCVGNLCAPGSKCVDGISRYTCECSKGYMGTYCNYIDPCASNSRICNNGKCASLPESGSFECSCDWGFKGEFCDIDVDECAESKANLCYKHGTCVNLPGTFKCDCFRGYNGSQCENTVNTCESENVNCLNGGECLIGPGREPICQCQQGFIGKRCQTACPSGFGGIRCDVDLSTPICGRSVGKCINGGLCLEGTCKCPPEFTGNHCEISRTEATLFGINTCDGDPCLNNATCINVLDRIGYVCICKDGFEGDVCERKRDACSTNPCFNGGVCSAKGNEFKCNCPLGFSGKQCENIQTIDCFKRNECENGGICVTDDRMSKCECSDGFFGRKCEEKINTDMFVTKDKLFREMCEKRNCSSRANDGNCDLDCNFSACDFDGGDCSGKQRPFAKCKYGNMCAHLFANGVCDQACNNEQCLYDGMDCMPKVERCPMKIREHCAAKFANGFCDVECNSDACGFDGGDCEDARNKTDTQLLTDIRVKILMSPLEFQAEGGAILMRISSALRSIIRLQRDDEGALVFAWNGEDDVEGKRVKMNMRQLEKQRVIGSVVLRNRRNVEDVGEDGKRGVIAWLEVEVDKRTSDSCSRFATDRSSCLFSSSQSVVDYLSAEIAKKGDSGIGVPIYEAMVAKPNRPKLLGNSIIMGVIAFLIIAIAFGGVVLMRNDENRSRKRKIIAAPIWIPPPEHDNEKGRPRALSSSQSSLLGSSGYSDVKRGKFDGYDMINGQYQVSYQQQNLKHHRIEPQFAADCGGYGQVDFNQKNKSISNPVTDFPDISELCKQAAGAFAITVSIENDNVNEADPHFGRCILHWLASNSAGKPEELIIEEVKTCLKVGAEVNLRDSEHNTPLMLAVRTRRVRLAVILMRAGGDPTIFNKSERSALHEAAVNLDFRMIQILLTDKRMISQIDELDRNGRTALMEVARLDTDIHIAQLLLSHGAKIEADGANRKESEIYKGRTALHYAALVGNLTMVRFLVSKNGNKDKQDEAGQTPIMLAAREGHIATVELLITHGASLDTTDLMDMTVRQLAESQHYLNIVELIDRAMMGKQENSSLTHAHSSRATKNLRPTVKSMKRSASRKGDGRSTSSSRGSIRMTPPPSDGSMSSPSPHNDCSLTPPNSFQCSTSPGPPSLHVPPNAYHRSNLATSCASATNVCDSSPEYYPPDSILSYNTPMWYGSSPPYHDMTSNSFIGIGDQPHMKRATELTTNYIGMTDPSIYY